jgi:imidazolonepropionase-like amidohydrolase
MSFWRMWTTVALLVTISTPSLSATWVQVDRWLDVTDGQMHGASTIVVSDGVIQSIRKGHLRGAPEDEVVTLPGLTVLPGLMDMHVHLIGQFSPRAYMERWTLSPAAAAIRASLFARRTLLAGFTTVRDLGDSDGVVVALRDAIARGWADGPRIYAAGKAIGSTGGHVDPTNGMRPDRMGDPGPESGVINGPMDARKAVRQRYKEGSDLIKIAATGGVLSLAKNGQNPQLTDDELEAIVATAHDYGFTVAVHAHGTEGMLRAVRAGVDSIEHGTFMDKEVMHLMKKKGVFFVPTLLAGDFVTQKAKIDGYFPDVVRPKAARIGPMIRDTFAKAYRAGVPIAFGTDTGVSPHGENAREFELMVAAGMKPLDAIRAATIQAARLLRIGDKAGSISKGMWADLIAVEGNPLDDIGVLRNIRFVMKDGKVYKMPGNDR